jgi:hypothetical protein
MSASAATGLNTAAKRGDAAEASCFPPSGRLGCIGRLGDRPFLGGFNNPWQADRKGRAATGLALNRDVAAHHLTEAPADGEAKAGAAVTAARRKSSIWSDP